MTIPRFLSAGLIVMIDFLFFKLDKALCCSGVKNWVISQMCGKLSSTNCFVSSMYFSKVARFVYRSCGDSMDGDGKNFIFLWIYDVVVRLT